MSFLGSCYLVVVHDSSIENVLNHTAKIYFTVKANKFQFKELMDTNSNKSDARWQAKSLLVVHSCSTFIVMKFWKNLSYKESDAYS